MDEERVRFYDLVGVKHSCGSKKAVIMAHGFTGNKDENGTFIRAAQKLCAAGYDVLRFDFGGSGESGWRFSDMTISSSIVDLKNAIIFMRDYEKRAVLGTSYGGMIALFCAHLAQSLVLWNPVVHPEQVFSKYFSTYNPKWESELELGSFKLRKGPKTYEVSRSFWLEAKRTDVLKQALTVRVPTLIVQGEKDDVTPVEGARELHEKLRSEKKLELLPTAHHGFHEAEIERVAVAATIDWLNKTL